MMQRNISIVRKLFPDNYELINGTGEIFELDLALWEYETLNEEYMLARSAYFKLINGKETTHFKLCNLQNLEEVHKNSSFRTRLFFSNGRYSTGYATHSLFPYRGKFHPQMIRALLNITKIKPGDVVFDPMAGSATLSVEANLLGIDSISLDMNPFCELMGKVKTFGLNLDCNVLQSITKNPDVMLARLNKPKIPDYFVGNNNENQKPYYEIILLAFLDSVGFANRSNYSVEKLYPRVLERYVLTIKNFQKARQKLNLKIGKSKILQGSVLNLPLEDNSVDAIITSPPYSFAIDYLKNDLPQLEYMGVDVKSLKAEMIGLQGQSIENKLDSYFEKINIAIKEMHRVAKKNAPIIVIVGTNTLQTKGVMLEKKIIELAKKQSLKFNTELVKPIRGLQNTMKSESILFFTNNKQLYEK